MAGRLIGCGLACPSKYLEKKSEKNSGHEPAGVQLLVTCRLPAEAQGEALQACGARARRARSASVARTRAARVWRARAARILMVPFSLEALATQGQEKGGHRRVAAKWRPRAIPRTACTNTKIWPLPLLKF